MYINDKLNSYKFHGVDNCCIFLFFSLLLSIIYFFFLSGLAVLWMLSIRSYTSKSSLADQDFLKSKYLANMD